MQNLSANKNVVVRFNTEAIQNLRRESFEELTSVDLVNHSSPSERKDRETMWNTFKNILKPAFSDLTVEIHQMIEEGDMVTTRKSIRGTHDGPLLGIPPTHQKVTIEVIDMVRIQNGRYQEHWGLNTLDRVLKSLPQS